jgi:hypothetical protein
LASHLTSICGDRSHATADLWRNLLGAVAGAGPAVAQDGRGGVKYSAWSAKKGKSCTVAINIVDPGNFKHYGFGFTGNALAVI